MLGKRATVTPLKEARIPEGTRTLLAEEPQHKVPYQRVRDGIIAFVRKTWSATTDAKAFVEPFCSHMSRIGWNKLDEYNDITIRLPEGGKLRFATSLYKGGQFVYTIESYDAEVPEEMKKRTFLGFEI